MPDADFWKILRSLQDHEVRFIRHQNLMTNCGALDVVGTIGTGLTYGDLLPHTIEVEFKELRVRVLGLAKIIELKEELRRDKDLAMLPTLRATLKEQQRGPV